MLEIRSHNAQGKTECISISKYKYVLERARFATPLSFAEFLRPLSFVVRVLFLGSASRVFVVILGFFNLICVFVFCVSLHCVSSVSVLWLAVAAYHKGGLWMYNMYAHGITGIMMV